MRLSWVILIQTTQPAKNLLHYDANLNCPSRCHGSNYFSFDDFCQQYLQNWWNEQSNMAPAAKSRPRRRAEDMSHHEAAAIIQKAWRKHIVSNPSIILLNMAT